MRRTFTHNRSWQQTHNVGSIYDNGRNMDATLLFGIKMIPIWQSSKLKLKPNLQTKTSNIWEQLYLIKCLSVKKQNFHFYSRRQGTTFQCTISSVEIVIDKSAIKCINYFVVLKIAFEKTFLWVFILNGLGIMGFQT